MLSILASTEFCIRTDGDAAKALRKEGRGVYLLPLGFEWEVLGATHSPSSDIWAGLLFGHTECRIASKSRLMRAICADLAPSDPHIEVPFLSIERRSLTWNAEVDAVYRVRPPVSVGDRLWVSEPLSSSSPHFDASGTLQPVATCDRQSSLMHLLITAVDLESRAGIPLLSSIPAARLSSMQFSHCASISFDVVPANIDAQLSGGHA